ncbi:hypothetical protein OF83DRAFT_1167490 [Amylostereum chailletii]|nr:hypothetical protein OF83DRAFT_1167490 [Amylostereum chailletii]
MAQRHDLQSLHSHSSSRKAYCSPSSFSLDNASRKRKAEYLDDSASDTFDEERDESYVDTEDNASTRTEESSIDTGARSVVDRRSTARTVPKAKGGGKIKPPAKVYYNALGVKLEVRQIKVDFDPHEWPKHVVEDETRGKWRCTWQTMRNGEPTTCQYTAKKHLVKRHIEATHMNIKRFECSWCFKTFTQKSNVAGCHLNTHSGEAPHECEYCDERFKDPSKKHKHMARFHSYGPRTSKKPRIATNQSMHETVTPWATRSPTSSQ